ncbi:MAG TPA: thiamine pyrophosphate-binding protein [Acidimicrobiia bacterium]|nr:thiamine pyrophosphate-binding protein [Acidimicrobiia bacterium]
MNVSEAVGRTLVSSGVRQVFGVVGSGNFHVTNAMIEAGADFVAARHEGGGATMTDAYGRMSGEVAVLTVHQGCGLTNAMTGITEAAKSRTPMVVVAAQATLVRSNFYVDQEMLARSVGAIPMQVTSAATAVTETMAAVETARNQRRTVILNLPLDIQGEEVEGPIEVSAPTEPEPVVPSDDDVAVLVDALEKAERPVFVAGRGSRGEGCRKALEALAEASGALLATSAVAKGLFNGNEWSLDVSGGFASPMAAELIKGADLIVGWGCALNMWTMRHGKLISEGTVVIQVDDDPDAIGAHRPGAIGVVGDVRLTAEAARDRIGEAANGYRSEEIRNRIATELRWRDVPYEDNSTNDRIDARTLSIALDELLPDERIVSIDSGNFMGYPSMYLSVPDEWGFCFTQAFQSIGLGLATGIGAALARPDRLPVAALGDGGGLMSIAEMETVVRLALPMVVVVYNDDAYGAEVHHFGPDGHDLDIVEFPPTDIAAIARGFGFEALTVRKQSDLAPVADWVNGDRSKPLLIDAKVTSQASWWLEEAFGH